jgi:hypothetical protein
MKLPGSSPPSYPIIKRSQNKDWNNRAGVAATEITVKPEVTGFGTATFGGVANVIQKAYSESGANVGPVVLEMRYDSSFFDSDSPASFVKPSQAKTHNYLSGAMASSDFDYRNPNNWVYNSNDSIVKPPTAEERKPLEYLDKPNAPQVKKIQQEFTKAIEETTNGVKIKDIIADPKKLEKFPATDLTNMLSAAIDGVGIPYGNLQTTVGKELNKKYFDNQPQTKADLPLVSVVDGKTVVFKPTAEQQKLRTTLIKEHNRRSEQTANTLIEEGKKRGLDKVQLPYSEAELEKMGLRKGTPFGDSGRMILANFVQRSGNPELLKSMFPPDKAKFSFKLNDTTDKELDYQAMKTMAAISYDKTIKGEPEELSKIPNSPYAEYFPKGAKVNGNKSVPFSQVSFNLPIIAERSQTDKMSPLDKAVDALGNEAGNRLFQNKVNDVVGYKQPVSQWSREVQESAVDGPVAELLSDSFQTYVLGTSAEERKKLDQLAEKDPQAAVRQFLGKIDDKVTASSTQHWSKLTPEQYQTMRKNGLSEEDSATFRHGVIYKNMNGGIAGASYNDKERQTSEAAFANALKDMGMGPALTKAFADYTMNQFLPNVAEASNRANSRGFNNEAKDFQAELKYLTER